MRATNLYEYICRTSWLISKFVAFRPRGFGFDPKSFTRSYLWRFGVKLRHSIRAE